MEVVAFGFFVFLYLKILSSFMFSYSISIIACFIISILICIATLVIGHFLFRKLHDAFIELVRGGKPSEQALEFVVVRFSLPIITLAIFSVFTGFLVVHGFSEQFTKAVLNSEAYERLSFNKMILFSILMSGPSLIFYLPQAVKSYLSILALK